jgi:hypothetical protein
MFWLMLFLVLFVLPHVWTASLVYGGSFEHWSQARWDSAGLAPDPASTPEPVVQVYAARAWGWKGVFAVHSWIVTKRANAPAFERYEVVGWGVRRGAPAVRRNMREIDGRWAGNRPELLLDRRGPEVEALIDQIDAAIMSYPYPEEYRTWPGPNSNTFTAHIGRAVPALGLELPPTAIGTTAACSPARRAAPATRCRCSACWACPWPGRKVWRSTCSASPSASIRSASRSSCRASAASAPPDQTADRLVLSTIRGPGREYLRERSRRHSRSSGKS